LIRYFLKRTAAYLLVLVVAVSVNFFLPRSIPGNPIEELSSGVGSLPIQLDQGTLKSLRGFYGLDQPILFQYWRYLKGLATGDLGYSISYRAPVAQLLLLRLPWTLFLTLSALIASFAAALVLGSRSGWKNEKEWQILVPAILLESAPPFVLGSFLLIFFSVKLPLFPLSGAYDAFSGFSGGSKVFDLAHHAALPILVLATSGFFSAYLVVRGSVLLVRDEPYVLMAEIKGLSERMIRRRYVLRNALLPVVTFFGMRLAHSVVGGAVLVEVVFAYPGIGRLCYEAVLSHDYPLLQGIFLTFTFCVLVINLCTDCLYVGLDPRVKEV